MPALRTPLKKVHGWGSAKGGTEHFVLQRVTGGANLILLAFLVYAALHLTGAPRAEVKAFFSQPWAAIAGILFAFSISIHMRIGMQVIIEDYIHGGSRVLIMLLLNTFFSISVGAAVFLAVTKLYLGV
jgi:succinate dehydrogenase / fumarate reductase, membrane anchor subunit